MLYANEIKNMKKTNLIITIFFLLPIFTFIILFLSDSTNGKILYTSTQPNEINYSSYDPYTLTIVEGKTKWRTLGWPKSKILKITKLNEPSYGHSIDLDIPGTDFTKTKAKWNNVEIELTLCSWEYW